MKHWFEAFFASKAFVTAFFRVSLLLATQAERGAAELATTGLRPAASELSGGKILWRILVSWLRQVFSGKREAE